MDKETTYSKFLHLSAGIRSTTDSEDSVNFWPVGKNLAIEVTSFPHQKFGETVTNAGLRCIGVEERAWSSGYEDRFWNPALVSGLGERISDWPGHDWSALGNAHRESCEAEPCRLSSAAGFHLMGASRRLMHISEWYHQMLLYAHLKGFHDGMGFTNSDHMNFLIDCHGFLTEAGSARDHIAAYAASEIAGISGISTFSGLARKRDDLSGRIKEIVEHAWNDNTETLTLRHIGRYRNEIVHQRPMTELSKGIFETLSFDLGLEKPLLGVKFDIQVWPNKVPDLKFDALRTFHSMMRVLYEFSRAVISLSRVKPKVPQLVNGKNGIRIKEKPTRRVLFPPR